MSNPSPTHTGVLPASAFGAAIILAIAGVVALVLTNASESRLVDFSYLLVPLAVFGIAGLALTGRRFKPALIWAVGALVALFVFLVVIFPML